MKYIYVLIGIICLCGCEEYYLPNVNANDTIYAFDCLITDQPGPYVIKITKANGYDSNDKYSIVDNADVCIVDNDSMVFKFNYCNGHYYSDTDFIAKIGKSYQLRVHMNEGMYFYSEWEELLACPDIIDITADIYTLKKVDNNNRDIVEDGIVIMNTTNAKDHTPYYRYDCKMVMQTMQYYSTPTPIERYIFRPNTTSGSLIITESTDYENSIIEGNNLFNVPRQAFNYEDNNIIPNTPFYVYNSGIYVSVRQYSMSNKQYQYWMSVNDQQKNNNYLFGDIENQPVGNISGSNGEIALGYFCVSAIKSKSKAFSLLKSRAKSYDIDYFPQIDTLTILETRPDFTIQFYN